jgi:hypothetical protein
MQFSHHGARVGQVFWSEGGGVLSVVRHQAATGRRGQSQFSCESVVGHFRVVLLVFVVGLIMCGCGVELFYVFIQGG